MSPMRALTFAVAIVTAGALPPGSAAHAMGRAFPDTVRGVVFDSLSRRPLAGATVMIEPTGQSVTTDDLGRFVAIANEKITRLTAFHAVLDRTGIGSLTTVLGPELNPRVTIATPSATVAWERLCPGIPRPVGREGVVFGTARASDGTTRIARARIRITWDKGPADRTTGIRQFEVRTDTIGTYYACGVPAEETAYIVGYSSDYASGNVAIAGDSLPLRKLDLTFGKLKDAASGTFATTTTVTGFVRDERRRGIAEASVDIDGLEVGAKTDAAGRFRIANVPTGSRMVLARAVGYTPTAQPVDVLERNTEEVQLELTRSILLPNVTVTERLDVPVLRAEFDERKRIGFGAFLDSAAVARKTNVRNIFEGIPSLEVTGRDQTGFRLFTPQLSMQGGACAANVFLDGRKSDTFELHAFPKDWIVGVEVYVRQPNAPAKYRPMTNACGVVLVWTRQAFMK